MIIKIQEFDNIKEVENFLNVILLQNDLAGYTIIPYQEQPCVVKYLVSCTVVEKSTI